MDSNAYTTNIRMPLVTNKYRKANRNGFRAVKNNIIIAFLVLSFPTRIENGFAMLQINSN